ncbi:MAG: hypothetical protein JWL79_2072 [Frankiales bacterium]|jgi:hypothetical protein|nr:hypothetical protein [Frankiales bacterium]
MTTTIPQQDLSISAKPTQADAQLLVSLINGPMAQRAYDGSDLLMGYDSPPTFAQFDADHPRGSEGARAVSALLGFNETLGTFVKQGLLDRGLVYDLYWVAGLWERSAAIALHVREKSGVAAMYENFEALAKGQT